MHIKYRDKNIVVKYLQEFLRSNYDSSLIVSGVYDETTHNALINYVKLPNVQPMSKFKKAITDKFTFVEDKPPYIAKNGGGLLNFNVSANRDEVMFRSKMSNKSYSNAYSFIKDYTEDLEKFAESMGWSLEEYTNPNYNGNQNQQERLFLKFVKSTRENIFPHNEVISMINMFSGEYIYEMCIEDYMGYAGYIHTSSAFKVAVIPCKPGDTYTIAHGYDVPCEMVVAYTTNTLKEIKSEIATAENIVSYLSNSTNGPLGCGSEYNGDYIIYNVPYPENDSDPEARYLLVQMPFQNTLSNSATTKKRVLIGDINMDGVIDEKDLQILTTYVTEIQKGNDPPFNLSGASRVAANINQDYDVSGNPIIDMTDLTLLREAIENSEGTIINLGSVIYDSPIVIPKEEKDRLLVLMGDDIEDDSKLIPIERFCEDPWMVNERFIEYLLGRVIHKYSRQDDIVYLQDMISKLYTYRPIAVGYFDSEDDYLTDYYVEAVPNDSICKIMKNSSYTGYYINRDNHVINEATGQDSSYYVINNRLISDKKQESYIICDNYIVKSGYENSLRGLVKRYQDEYNSFITLDVIDESRRKTRIEKGINYSLGSLDLTTESHMIVSTGGDDISG